MDLLEYLNQRLRKTKSYKEKATLRKDLVKAIINSYPPETPITFRDFAAAIGLRPRSSGIYTLVRRMADTGEIRSFKREGTRRAYAVLKPGNTYDEERGFEPTPKELVKEGYVNPSQVYAQRLRRAKESELLNNEIEEAKVEKTYTFEELEELAMKFQFYNYGLSMSVAQFLEKLKEQ